VESYKNLLTGWSVNQWRRREKQIKMIKTIKIVKERVFNSLFALVLALSLGLVAYAQSNIEQKVTFYLDGKVGEEMVKKGTYTVLIPESEEGKLEIKVGKRSILAPFTKRQDSTQAEADKMTYRDNPDGTRTIATITPRGRKFTLVLDNGSMARQ
jgi:Fucose-binding lectin II (PA-IIL)